jgi:hypothetical protein
VDEALDSEAIVTDDEAGIVSPKRKMEVRTPELTL